jgi:FkbM family methyltransferase
MRYAVDAFFCRSFDDKECIGKENQWTIRTGGLNSRSVVYSGGVGEDISFETILVERFRVSIRLFDPSPPALETVARTDMTNIDFVPQGLSGRIGTQVFATCERGSGKEWKLGKGGTEALRAPCTTIYDQMQARGEHSIDLLKIDIEGFEYEVLQDCLEKKIPIRQVCVEFHHFYKEISIVETMKAIRALNRAGFTLIHKRMCDLTFYRF